jgi:hypothetical protein
MVRSESGGNPMSSVTQRLLAAREARPDLQDIEVHARFLRRLPADLEDMGMHATADDIITAADNIDALIDECLDWETM